MKNPAFDAGIIFFCFLLQYTSGCEYLAGIGDRGYKILKYNFFQEAVDRKCKWIYNPDIVKNSLKSGRESRKAAGIEDPGTVKKEEKMVIGKIENRKSKFRKCAAACSTPATSPLNKPANGMGASPKRLAGKPSRQSAILGA